LVSYPPRQLFLDLSSEDDAIWAGDAGAFGRDDSPLDSVAMAPRRHLPVSHLLDSMALAEPEPSLDEFDDFGLQAFESNAMPSPPLTTASLAEISSPDAHLSSPSDGGDAEDAENAVPPESQRRSKPAAARRKRLAAAAADGSRRDSHSRAEKRYRETLQTGLERLRQVVPAVSETDGANKMPKAGVLFSAVRHIRGLERERAGLTERNERLAAEIIRLRRAAEAMRKEIAFVHSVYGPGWQHGATAG